MWVFFFACGEPPETSNSIFQVNMVDYHSLSEDRSWTYRDEFDVDPNVLPDENNLLLARSESGYVSFRRGARWADATDIGHLEWDFVEGLSLLSWDLPFSSGSDLLPISGENPEEGETANLNGWVCTMSKPESVWTYYAEYDKVLYFACSNDSLVLDLYFAKGAGLINLMSSDYEMELVAPW